MLVSPRKNSLDSSIFKEVRVFKGIFNPHLFAQKASTPPQISGPNNICFQDVGQGGHPKGPKIEKIQSQLKFSIPLENFNLAWNFQSRPSEFPHNKKGLVGGALEIFNLVSKKNQDLEFFQSLGP